MSAQTVIDSLEFARTEQTLHGALPVAGLARLREELYDTLGEVEFVVRGGHDRRGRPTLGLGISVVLHLRCQRCLGQLAHPLEVASTLLLARPGAADPDVSGEEEDEWIESSAALDVVRLVEDEIILALPYAPRHPEGQCRATAEASRRNEGQSPFARLAALKRN